MHNYNKAFTLFNYTWLYNCSEGVAHVINVCLQYKYQHKLNTVECASPQFDWQLTDNFQIHLKTHGFTLRWKFGVKQGNLNLDMLLFTAPERKTNCTLNKTWAVQDVVTVWQKPSYWLPAKPDQGDLTPKGCLQLSFFETPGWAAYSSWSGCDVLTRH